VDFLVRNVTEVNVTDILRRGDEASFKWGLRSFYDAIANATINNSVFSMPVWIPELGLWVN